MPPGRVPALLFGLLFVAALSLPAPAAEEPLARRIASYEIEARLAPDTRQVEGRVLVRWQNTTRKDATELCFHLYLNAFANNRTTLMSASPEKVARWSSRHPDEWGGIDVTAIELDEADLTADLEFIQPDDGNPFDRTVARLPLPGPVKPSGRVEVAVDFKARLPRLFERTGHAAPFFFVAQWFPKLGVFEDGGWNCHQLHASTEFFADFGTYDVRLTVPEDYVVGSTGVVREEHHNADGTKTIDIHAEGVHDFAWTADPRFQEVEERIGEVRVRLLVQPQHRGQADRYLGALRQTMTLYERWIGPYPYPQLTLVDPGPGGYAAAGMEYPMLFTVGTTWWMPRGIRLPELLTVHEFGHQYWQGMVASDEVNSPWLDEGINSYLEGRIMDEVYGPGSYVDLLGLEVDATAKERLRYLLGGLFDPIDRPAHRMLDPGSYAATAYAKPALMLATLDRMLGEDRLLDALGDYFRKWRFRHPTTADWRASIESSTGADLGRYFDQVLGGTGVLDYAVARVEVVKLRSLEGRGPDFAAEEVRQRRSKRFRNEIVFVRRGEVRMPVELLVVFNDGSEMRESWDGEDRWRRLDVTGNVKAEFAVIDPDGKLPLDVNRLNNSRMRSAGTRGIVRLAGRWGLWMQGVLHALTGF